VFSQEKDRRNHVDELNSTCERQTMRQVEMAFRTHGGYRPGAGRKKPVGRRCSEPHRKRPAINPRHPLHVVLRSSKRIGSLRIKPIYDAIREAMRVSAANNAIRIVHLSIQRSHIHLIVESANKATLARGLKAFQISAARRINTARDTEGVVFTDRYFATPLTTPRQIRHTIAYVLNNWRHHAEDEAAFARAWRCDPFSTGSTFDRWRELRGEPFIPMQASYEPLEPREPTTWLLRIGWKRHPAISFTEVPGGKHAE
jgi:REP element-mobilizing transposase RayT